MRHITLLFAVIAFPAFAEEKAKPNTLTPKQISEGWILLFDGETTFGWRTQGEVTAKNGNLVLKGGDQEASVTIPVALESFELLLETAPRSGNGELVLGGDPSKKVSTRLPAG